MARMQDFVFPLKDLHNDRVMLEILDSSRREHLAIAERLIALPEMFKHCAKPGWVDIDQFIQWHNESINNEPTACLFAVLSTTTSPPSPAGLIGLLHADAASECGEMGFVYVLPEWQRTHVLTNAAGLLIRYCMDELKLRRLYWRSSTENPASICAAERLCFKLEGVTRWCRVMDEVQEAGHRRGDDVRRGMHLATLALCWDDWESGDARKRLLSQMQRGV